MAAILIVDDDETIRDALNEMFSEEHLCHAAETADQALTWLETEVYDVVLTDISMPGMSGLELIGHIRQRQPETPVIVITGTNYQQHSGELLKLGAYDYLVKPFHLEEVEEVVARALAIRRHLLDVNRRRDAADDKKRLDKS